MSTRTPLVFICLLAACTSSRDLSPVLSTTIDPEDAATLKIAAQKVTAQRVEMATLKYEKYRFDPRETAWLETERAVDDEGVDRWEYLQCSKDARTGPQWQCLRGTNRSAFRMDATADMPAVEVSISNELRGNEARRMFSLAHSVLKSSTLIRECWGGRECTKAEVRRIKDSFVNPNGRELSLGVVPGGFQLHDGQGAIFFEFDPARDVEPRLKCWAGPEET